jgi:UDP-2,4-diacetamido-2,4,6-trideoxy-beta-L-altropyranose hydrolase
MSRRKSPEILFIADAGPEVGWGHYVRSRALADEMVSKGVKVHFYLRGKFPPHRQGDDFTLIEAGDITAFLGKVQEKVDIVVLDLYQCSMDILKPLEGSRALVCIDDGTDLLFNGPLLVIPNLNEESVRPSTSRMKCISGSKFILLRPEFDRLPKRKCSPRLDHLLVAFGGTDPTHLTPHVVNLLKNELVLPCRRVTVLVGEDSQGTKLESSIACDQRFALLRGVEDVRSILCDADLGILAGGTMLYEAAVTGLPTLVVSLNELQAREGRVFHEMGATLYLGDATELTADRLMCGLRDLNEMESRQKMADNAQKSIDGQGRRRVAEAILELVTGPMAKA